MSKKGDLSLNVVIIAALGLIVLVVLTAIFISRMNTAADKTNKNDDLATSNLCFQPRDKYSQIKCVDSCNSDDGGAWTTIKPAQGSGAGAASWMDCASPKVCCGLLKE
jgi:cell division protein FtsN